MFALKIVGYTVSSMLTILIVGGVALSIVANVLSN